MSERFRFTAVVAFEIDEHQAANILADPFPNIAVETWLTGAHPVGTDGLNALRDKQRSTSFELNELKKQFGLHLADKKVAECKHLADINQPVEA